MIYHKKVFDLQGFQNLVGLFVGGYLKKVLFFFGCVLCLQTMTAQKVVKKSIVNPEIDLIQIDAKNCFELALETSDTDEIVIEATIDGEYKKDLLLNVKQEGATMVVNAGFQPNFKNPNDKLSAHKVVSIALKINLPKYKNVHVFGTNCNVTATGFYKNLKVILSDGRCSLNEVAETAEIITQSGNIIASYSEAKVIAESKYGTVEKEAIPEGNNRYTLRTTTGNILLKRLE